MIGQLNRCLLFLAAALALALLAAPSGACPFCSMQGQTLTGEVSQASMVLFGKLTNGKEQANGEGTTDLQVEFVVKDHDIRAGKKTVTLERYIDTGAAGDVRYLVFCDVFKNKIDPYRGIAVDAKSDMPKYLKGALEQKDARIDRRLRFFFDYLDNPDVEISNDAYKEFANADYKDYHDMAKNLPADKVAGWLKDPKTPGFRYGLYASMLGHCGKPEHAKLLRNLLEDPEKRVTSGVDGLLAGYVMLLPKDGWEYVKGLLKDPKKEFALRYAALRALRFFWDYRTDLVAKKDLAEAAALLLEQSDIADLAVEDLRKWGCWDMTDRVLGLQKKEAYNIPIVKRAVLRFALCAKDNKEAQKYIQEQRAKDPEGVSSAEELLKLEQDAKTGK
jgi:hypothetical protein